MVKKLRIAWGLLSCTGAMIVFLFQSEFTNLHENYVRIVALILVLHGFYQFALVGFKETRIDREK